MSSEYRRFHGCVYRLDTDKAGKFCRASKLVQGEWEPLQLNLRAMLLIDSDGKPISPEELSNTYIGKLELDQG